MAVPLVAVVTTLKESRSAILLDVSAAGARLQGTDLPHSGEELFVTVDGVVAFGRIAWEKGGERGLEFDAPLDPQDEKLLRKKVAHARGLPPELKAAFEDWALGFAR